MTRLCCRIHICDVTPFLNLYICDVTLFSVWNTDCGNVEGVWRDSFIFVTWLVFIVACKYVTHFCVLPTKCGNVADMWRDSFICVTCFVCMVAYIYVTWLFFLIYIFVTWLLFLFGTQTAVMLQVRGVTPFYMWHASSILSHAYMWRDSFLCFGHKLR